MRALASAAPLVSALSLAVFHSASSFVSFRIRACAGEAARRPNGRGGGIWGRGLARAAFASCLVPLAGVAVVAVAVVAVAAVAVLLGAVASCVVFVFAWLSLRLAWLPLRRCLVVLAACGLRLLSLRRSSAPLLLLRLRAGGWWNLQTSCPEAALRPTHAARRAPSCPPSRPGTTQPEHEQAGQSVYMFGDV